MCGSLAAARLRKGMPCFRIFDAAAKPHIRKKGIRAKNLPSDKRNGKDESV